MQNQLLTVITRMHTVEGEAMHLLGRMLLSLAGASYSPIQPLVVTQGFPDRDLQKVRELLGEFIWDHGMEPQAINCEPSCPGDHRAALLNLGIHSAEGRFLAFLDYDDYVYEHAYATLIGRLQSSCAGVAFGGCRTVHAEPSPHGYKHTSKAMPWAAKTLDDFLADNIFPPASYVIDRAKFDREVLCTDGRLTRLEDYCLLLKLRAVTTFDLTHFETPLCEYVIRKDGTTTFQLGADDDTRENQLAWETSRNLIAPLRLSLGCLRGRPQDTLATLPIHAREQGFPAERRESREFVPAGHFYSAVPSLADRERALKSRATQLGEDIAMHSEDQMRLLEILARYRAECSLPAAAHPGHRYRFKNGNFEWFDGFLLYAMLRHFQPRRVVEVGSGFSSALMLDVKEQFPCVDLTFIEPHTDLLRSLMRPGDEVGARILEQAVQSVDLSVFRSLQANDILFIDSTHVLKCGSDVNFLFFEAMPVIEDGVIIHLHDIFYPWEYPAGWIAAGHAWNELYLLRAFLMHNDRYRVMLSASFAQRQFGPWLRERLPEFAEHPAGSFWMQKRKGNAS